MKPTHYALIQAGTTIFGVGETIEAARADAAQWLEEPQDAYNAPAETGLHGQYRVDGALVVVPCSAALAAHVRENGFDKEAWGEGDGYICLPSEA